MSNRTKGLTFALVSAVLYGTIPIFGKKIVVDFSPLFVALMVTILAGFFLGIVGFWKKEIFRNLISKNIIWVVILGFLAALGSAFSFFGLSIGMANEAGFLFQFGTFFATILAFLFLKEKLSYFQVSGLIIMFVGAYVFTGGISLSFKMGNIFFLSAAFVWGVNDVIVRKKVSNLPPLFLSFGRNFFSSIFLLPLAIGFIPQSVAKMSTGSIVYFLVYGFIVAGIILTIYTALKYIKVAEATSFQLLIPIITATISFFILGERLSAIQFIGGAIILVGLYLMTRNSGHLTKK